MPNEGCANNKYKVPTINLTIFPNIHTSHTADHILGYWSSSNDRHFPSDMMVVDFAVGSKDPTSKKNYLRLRLVRYSK